MGEPKNIKTLQAILEFHVVPGAAVHSKDIKCDTKAKTLQGEQLLVQSRFGRVYVNRKARVTTANVDATNGVVHIIDTVLIPSKINGRPAGEVLHPCSVDKIPKSYQLQYRFEFAALDKNHNGYLTPSEFKSKGVQIAKTFQNYRGNPDDKKKGRGGRQLASSFWDNLRKRFQDRWKARQEANMAQGVFNKADSDNSKQLSLCEYSNAMYRNRLICSAGMTVLSLCTAKYRSLYFIFILDFVVVVVVFFFYYP